VSLSIAAPEFGDWKLCAGPGQAAGQHGEDTCPAIRNPADWALPAQRHRPPERNRRQLSLPPDPWFCGTFCLRGITCIRSGASLRRHFAGLVLPLRHASL